MVRVTAEQGMGCDVAQIIDRQHHPRLQLPLNTNIHLDRARSLVIRVIQIRTSDVRTVSQYVSYVHLVLGRPCRQHSGLVLLLQSDDLLEYVSDRLAADLVRSDIRRKRQGLGIAVLANVRGPKEQPLLQSTRTVEQDVVPD